MPQTSPKIFSSAELQLRVESATELGSAVLDLLTNAARRDQMIARAHEILQNNRGTLARLLALIERLLRR
jgi:3-deoxy-D-manno-octulosonic-acid transferase